ncbi:MAG: hypothetical protein RBR97_17405 [Bacteroidales bacterium]|nr:hypothetical protein [Bacteroidales bacterium]
MKNKIVKFGLIKEGEGWETVENANVFTEEETQVLNFNTEKERKTYIKKHNIILNEEINKIDIN